VNEGDRIIIPLPSSFTVHSLAVTPGEAQSMRFNSLILRVINQHKRRNVQLCKGMDQDIYQKLNQQTLPSA
jgi:hypothetical protein